MRCPRSGTHQQSPTRTDVWVLSGARAREHDLHPLPRPPPVQLTHPRTRTPGRAQGGAGRFQHASKACARTRQGRGSQGGCRQGRGSQAECRGEPRCARRQGSCKGRGSGVWCACAKRTAASLATLVANAPAKGRVKQRGEREMERGKQYACEHACGLAALIAKTTAKGGVRKRGGGRERARERDEGRGGERE